MECDVLVDKRYQGTSADGDDACIACRALCDEATRRALTASLTLSSASTRLQRSKAAAYTCYGGVVGEWLGWIGLP